MKKDYGKIAVTNGGIWDDRTFYEKLTTVSRNGQGYLSFEDNQGVDPETDCDSTTGLGSKWMRTANKGDKGDKGDAFTYEDFTPEQIEGLRGPQGPTGATGATGATGPQGPQGEKGDPGTTDYNQLENTPIIPDALSDLQSDSTHRTVTDAQISTWNNKQNALQYDSVPTSNSPKMLTSGAIYTAISGFVTASVNNLVNYYRKDETYSQLEIQQLLAAVKQFTYVSVGELPTPGASTMNKIYLVPSSKPAQQNVKDEFITIAVTAGNITNYSWEQIGSTAIDLSGYYTSLQTDAAIQAALAYYTTTADLQTLLAGKQDLITDLDTIRSQAGSAYQKPVDGIPETDLTAAVQTKLDKAGSAVQPDSLATVATSGSYTDLQNKPDNRFQSIEDHVLFMEKSFGKYDGQREITLQQAKAGKYVNVDGGETTATGYGISTPITLNAGDILLIPSAQAVPASVSVVARMVDRTYQKVIAYIYTYRTDYPELPATATADYDATLVYTAVYDESGDTPVLAGWTRNSETYTTLPATREVSEQFYEPLMRQAVSAMPSTGYYIYLCPTAMTVVISGYTATVSGGTALVVGWGIFKNITTNFVGAPGQSVLAQAFAVLFATIDGLKAQLENLGETKAVSIDFENSPKLCGQDMYLTGNGAPASPNVPTMVGQEYLDVTNKKCYKAFSVTGSISDWVLLN